eukprot:jgi/Mesen1/3529/ME000197S02541
MTSILAAARTSQVVQLDLPFLSHERRASITQCAFGKSIHKKQLSNSLSSNLPMSSILQRAGRKTSGSESGNAKGQTRAAYLGNAATPQQAASNAVNSAARGDTKSFLLFLAVPLIAGAVVSLISNPLQKWYMDLDKPAWTPPSPLFGGAWSVLYALMGYSSWLVWQKVGWTSAMTVYGVQLVLNLLWQLIFFRGHALGFAFGEILVLLVAIAQNYRYFDVVDHRAAQLLLPYAAWVAFAAMLNYNIWQKNGNSPGEPSPSY